MRSRSDLGLVLIVAMLKVCGRDVLRLFGMLGAQKPNEVQAPV